MSVLDKILFLIEKNGISILLSGVMVYLMYKFMNKMIDRKQCIYQKEFTDLKDAVLRLENLFKGYIYGGRYRGKDE